MIKAFRVLALVFTACVGLMTVGCLPESNDAGSGINNPSEKGNIEALDLTKFYINNQSSYPIKMVFITPSSKPYWGSNKLSSPIPPGVTRKIGLFNTTKNPYDLRVVTTNATGFFHDFYGITVPATVILSNDTFAITTAQIVEGNSLSMEMMSDTEDSNFEDNDDTGKLK